MMIDLIDENRQQLSLLDPPQTEEKRKRGQKLMDTMDALNEKMGKGTVRLGLPEKNTPWHLRCVNRSPPYTTNWDELMMVYADEGTVKRNIEKFNENQNVVIYQAARQKRNTYYFL